MVESRRYGSQVCTDIEFLSLDTLHTAAPDLALAATSGTEQE